MITTSDFLKGIALPKNNHKGELGFVRLRWYIRSAPLLTAKSPGSTVHFVMMLTEFCTSHVYERSRFGVGIVFVFHSIPRANVRWYRSRVLMKIST